MKLGDLGEFGLIDRIAALFPQDCPGCLDGIGDDCAVLEMNDGQTGLLVTTDLLIEPIHFIRDKIPPGLLGRKALAVNLSDIAAMGGSPWGFFLSMAVPPSIDLDYIDAFMMGIHERAIEFNTALLGGDTTRSAERFAINITVLGTAHLTRIKRRRGARPGDVIQVSGPIGSSSAGLRMLLKNNNPGVFEPLLKAHFDPFPRIVTGQAVAAMDRVTAMIDVSDGLLQDLGHICSRSGVGADIDFDAIPRDSLIDSCARRCEESVVSWVLSGGEDYELLWTVHADEAARALDVARSAGADRATSIGTITAQSGIRVFRDGNPLDTRRMGWDHFRDA